MSPHVRHADDLPSHLFHDIELMDLARAFVEPEQADIGCCHINGALLHKSLQGFTV